MTMKLNLRNTISIVFFIILISAAYCVDWMDFSLYTNRFACLFLFSGFTGLLLLGVLKIFRIKLHGSTCLSFWLMYVAIIYLFVGVEFYLLDEVSVRQVIGGALFVIIFVWQFIKKIRNQLTKS